MQHELSVRLVKDMCCAVVSFWFVVCFCFFSYWYYRQAITRYSRQIYILSSARYKNIYFLALLIFLYQHSLSALQSSVSSNNRDIKHMKPPKHKKICSESKSEKNHQKKSLAGNLTINHCNNQ